MDVSEDFWFQPLIPGYSQKTLASDTDKLGA